MNRLRDARLAMGVKWLLFSVLLSLSQVWFALIQGYLNGNNKWDAILGQGVLLFFSQALTMEVLGARVESALLRKKANGSLTFGMIACLVAPSVQIFLVSVTYTDILYGNPQRNALAGITYFSLGLAIAISLIHVLTRILSMKEAAG